MSGMDKAGMGEVTKWVITTVISALVGFAGKSMLATNSNETALAAHTTQLQKLWDGQGKTTDALTQLNITVARIEGKVDVINQKVDDDRAAKQAPK